MDSKSEGTLLNGDEAIALAAMDGGIALGVGYPGTPSTEILEAFSQLGGRAQWSPNEKVAFEVGLGAAYARGRVLVTMKHVGLNVAADPLFTAAYTGVDGALVIAVADDPGMASSQNEQDSRRYAIAAGVPMLEPADSQQAYDLMLLAIEISERWKIPVLLRVTTRVCHSKSIVRQGKPRRVAPAAHYERDPAQRVMVPGNARRAHVRLRAKLNEIATWGGSNGTIIFKALENSDDPQRGIVASGVSVMHAREADPRAEVLQVVLTHPLPIEKVRSFVERHNGAAVIEEGDPVLWESCKAADIAVADRKSYFRFGELNVVRVRRMLAGDDTPEKVAPPGKPPQLCVGCPHRVAFEVLKSRDCIVSGDIGCYTLGVMPPFEAMDTTVCMGASITVGLGLRQLLPADEARRVVSVIGDSTFVHSGLTGIAEMVYNPPPSGHLVVILDNGTTAMTGMQEHPATGRRLAHEPTNRLSIEGVVQAMGVEHVVVVDHVAERSKFEATVDEAMSSGGLWVIVARRHCILAAPKIREYEAGNQ